MADKPFDLILIGATGFTGQRAARYLKKHAPESLKWGIAARNPSKMQPLASELGISNDRCFRVDTTLRDEVESVVAKTRIIITTVGPFSLYGEEVIAACARLGTHYLDITGEVGFIKKMKDRYESLALESGAKLIPFSGFDSVPAELAAYLLSSSLDNPEKLSIRSYYSISGGFNGGTIATMLNKFETGEYKEMNDPALLIGENSTQKIHSPEKGNFFGYDRKIGRWSAPFIMGSINAKVVYQSASEYLKAGTPYAQSISYSEHASLGKWYNPFPFLMVSLVLLSITLLAPYSWFRRLLKGIMPAPGEGPTEKQIEQGYFKLTAYAWSNKEEKGKIEISYPGDPGNKSTVFFLCESAFCLAEQEDQLKSNSGFLTPSVAFGEHLADRLKKHGLRISKDI